MNVEFGHLDKSQHLEKAYLERNVEECGKLSMSCQRMLACQTIFEVIVEKYPIHVERRQIILKNFHLV